MYFCDHAFSQFNFLFSSGILTSTWTETIAMLSTDSHLANIDWPNLQLNFLGFLPDKEITVKHKLTDEVALQ